MIFKEFPCLCEVIKLIGKLLLGFDLIHVIQMGLWLLSNDAVLGAFAHLF